MALTAVLLRSQCKNFSPLISNIARMSSSAAIVPNSFACGGSTLTQNVHQTSPLLRVLPKTSLIGTKFAHRATAADDLRSSTGSHDKLWTAERLLSVGLLGIIPVGIMFPSQPTDAIMAVSIMMHQYWGLEAVVTDYIRAAVFGDVIPKIAHGLLILLTASTLGGLFYFIYNDIGIGNGVRKLWSIKGQ